MWIKDIWPVSNLFNNTGIGTGTSHLCFTNCNYSTFFSFLINQCLLINETKAKNNWF